MGSGIDFAAQGGSGQQGAIAFLTKSVDDDTTQPSEKMVITAPRNVGIGDTSPEAKLEVKATVSTTEAAVVNFTTNDDRRLQLLQPNSADDIDPWT